MTILRGAVIGMAYAVAVSGAVIGVWWDYRAEHRS